MARTVDELSQRLAAAQTHLGQPQDPRLKHRPQDVEMQRAHSEHDEQHANIERAFSGLNLERVSSSKKPSSPKLASQANLGMWESLTTRPEKHTYSSAAPKSLSLVPRRKSVRQNLAAMGDEASLRVGDGDTTSPRKRLSKSGPLSKKRLEPEPVKQEPEQTSSISLGPHKSKSKRKRRKGSPTKEAQITGGGSSPEAGSEYESPLVQSPTERSSHPSASRHSTEGFSFSPNTPRSG